jgi:3-oxoacyl-[acyl-carrier protein] reductase
VKNAVAIVTGASQGIGRTTAVRLALDFSGVLLVPRNGVKLDETANEVKARSFEPMVIELDMSKTAAPDTVVTKTPDRFGRIDALLNIAGAVRQIDVLEMTDQQWNDGMELKLHGARRLTVRAWDALKTNRGTVVLMSGNSALFPKSEYAAVATINAAIVAPAKAFSDRGLKDGVQVNSVLPGPVMTGRRESYLAHWAPAHKVSVQDAKQKFLSDAGIERYGRPEDIADLMAFLVSPGARWITGSAIRMAGGEVKSI